MRENVLHGSGALLCLNDILFHFLLFSKQNIWIVFNFLLIQSMAEQTMIKLLVFGGNGFLGGETVVELLALKTFDITVVNRGNWKNYDSNYRIRPFVKTIIIDRCES